VQWRLSINGARRLYFTWTESGMPILVIPEKLGFGTRLIAQLVENYERVFGPEGMTCRFELYLGDA
jgi:two-component sensor histidine kinase